LRKGDGEKSLMGEESLPIHDTIIGSIILSVWPLANTGNGAQVLLKKKKKKQKKERGGKRTKKAKVAKYYKKKKKNRREEKRRPRAPNADSCFNFLFLYKWSVANVDWLIPSHLQTLRTNFIVQVR
jgi:hypothetical protein